MPDDQPRDPENPPDARAGEARGTSQPAPPPIDFTTFLLSLGSSVMIHLGDAPHPDSGALEANLALAKQSIDLLELMQAKTRGNLAPDEARFLESMLYDLRLRYVTKAKAPPPAKPA